MKPNYEFNPIAEQALRPNQTVVPQRVNAALAFIASTSYMLRILLMFCCLILTGCSGDLPSVDLRQGSILVHKAGANRELSEVELSEVGAWLEQNRISWKREYVSLPPYPFVASVVMNYADGTPCALNIYPEQVVFQLMGNGGSQWRKQVPVSELNKLRAIFGIKSEG